jgi:mRNA interferase RelE/StbE
MAYQIELERRARKELTRLARTDQARVVAAIESLAENPRPAGCRPVQAAPKGTYRIRIGEYRVIYVVLDQERVVIIARVARRGESTYRGLG